MQLIVRNLFDSPVIIPDHAAASIIVHLPEIRCGSIGRHCHGVKPAAPLQSNCDLIARENVTNVV